MIFQAVYKDPDALYVGVEVFEEDNRIKLSEEEKTKLFETIHKKMKIGEYIVLEIDTEKETVIFKRSYP